MWKLWNTVRRTAPNFGPGGRDGIETWWEAKFRHTDGRILFAVGQSNAEAQAAGWLKIEMLESPEHRAALEAGAPAIDEQGNLLGF